MILKTYQENQAKLMQQHSPKKQGEFHSPNMSMISNEINTFKSPTHSTIHCGTDEKTIRSNTEKHQDYGNLMDLDFSCSHES